MTLSAILVQMLPIDFLASEITNRYGTIQRARGCFLYTRKGIRLTDMYQEGGRAVLGWGGGTAFTMFKNVLNRGLTGSFDSDYTPRITKAVSDLLAGDRAVYTFTDRTTALKAALSLSKDNTSFWKPWNQENIDWRNVGAVIVVPPLPWASPLYFVAVKPLLVEVNSAADKPIPESSRIPAALAAAAVRSVYDMISALQYREEKDWFIYDTVLSHYWTRKGPYLYPKVDEAKYGEFILHCLDCGLVISPDYNIPSVVPFGADKGVFSKLKNFLFEAQRDSV
jgi:hypothetical protein